MKKASKCFSLSYGKGVEKFYIKLRVNNSLQKSILKQAFNKPVSIWTKFWILKYFIRI